MKIVRNEPDILQFQSAPWFFGTAAVVFIVSFLLLARIEYTASDFGRAAAFLGIGLVVGGTGFCMFVRRSDVVFCNNNGTVKIAEKSVFGTNQKIIDLSNVLDASLESVGIAEATPRHRIVLNISDNERDVVEPLTRNYFGGSSMPSGADTINAWLTAARR